MFIVGIFLLVLGLILGSFCNVVILRHGIGELSGRSMCPHCKRTLAWYELVPVLSWIVLQGRCRTCARPISIQYPLVEALMGVFFLALGLSGAPIIEKLLGGGIVFFSVAIAAYDFRHTLMPDIWVYSFVALAFLYGVFALRGSPLMYLLLAGPMIAFPLFALWFVSRGSWMGFGDVKYALGMGWLLGPVGGFLALGIAFCSGAIVGVSLIAYERMKKYGAITPTHASQKGEERFTMKSEVPFGPFLIFGVCIVWFSALYHIPLLYMLGDFLSLS